MDLRQDVPRSTVDRRDQLRVGALSAGLTVLAMAIGFAVIAGVLITRETVILWNIWTRILALAIMYLVPHFVAGTIIGTRYGVGAVEPVVAAVVPVLVAILGLAAFGGPVGTVLQSPLILLLALLVWGGLFAGGQVVGARVVAPRLPGEIDLDSIRPGGE